MNTEQLLLKKWDSLSIEKQQQVLDFIDSILDKPPTEASHQEQWKYLEKRPHLWRKQLYVKGRRLKAFGVWMDMIVNEMTTYEAADNWDLPLAAIEEIIEYCETNQELLKQEADQERHYLEERGINLEPKVTH